VILLAAYPRTTAARKAARSLVRARLVACATVLPSGVAHYRWEGKELADPSVLLIGKTRASLASAAMEAIRASHPDRVPEILILPIVGGHAPYLRWLASETER
jgi:periplasmic divalent cation tolerance protein